MKMRSQVNKHCKKKTKEYNKNYNNNYNNKNNNNTQRTNLGVSLRDMEEKQKQKETKVIPKNKCCCN